jgi:hypothetical protein
MLCYGFTLSHNASTLRRKVIASYNYRSGLIESPIASYSYHSDLIGIVIADNSYRSKVIKALSLVTGLLLITAAMHACGRGTGRGDTGVMYMSNMHLDV